MRWHIPLLLGLIAMAAAGRVQAIPNHLHGQQSAYLKPAVLQPVDWHPWGGQAFQRKGSGQKQSIRRTES
jgi:hypothetical protein